MLEKFIELVEHQAAAYKLQREIDGGSDYHICSLNSVQLMDSAQSLFDSFCDRFDLVPKVTQDDYGGKTQLVRYKGLRVYVYGEVEP